MAFTVVQSVNRIKKMCHLQRQHITCLTPTPEHHIPVQILQMAGLIRKEKLANSYI
jgi:hypothetical protein